MRKPLIITINGTIFSKHTNTDIDEDEFNDAFAEFLEQHEWNFGGGTVCEPDDE